MSNLETLQEIANKLILDYPNESFTIFDEYWMEEDEDVLANYIIDMFGYELLGLCDCGRPEDTHEMLRVLLNARNDWHEGKCEYDEFRRRIKDELHVNEDDDIQYGMYQFVLYILNYKGFLYHGSSVGGSWLTNLGKMYLTVLNIQHELKGE